MGEDSSRAYRGLRRNPVARAVRSGDWNTRVVSGMKRQQAKNGEEAPFRLALRRGEASAEFRHQEIFLKKSFSGLFARPRSALRGVQQVAKQDDAFAFFARTEAGPEWMLKRPDIAFGMGHQPEHAPRSVADARDLID